MIEIYLLSQGQLLFEGNFARAVEVLRPMRKFGLTANEVRVKIDFTKADDDDKAAILRFTELLSGDCLVKPVSRKRKANKLGFSVAQYVGRTIGDGGLTYDLHDQVILLNDPIGVPDEEEADRLRLRPDNTAKVLRYCDWVILDRTALKGLYEVLALCLEMYRTDEMPVKPDAYADITPRSKLREIADASDGRILIVRPSEG